MKKSTKLLSLLLAILMIFSSVSVLASAHEAYGKGDKKEYGITDQGLAFMYTDEQRASWVCDKLNGVLAKAGLPNKKILGIVINMTSLDGIFDTMGTLEHQIYEFGGLLIGIDLGDLRGVHFHYMSPDTSLSQPDGAVTMLNSVLNFLNGNIDHLVDKVIADGNLSLGTLTGMLGDMLTKINSHLNLLPTIREVVYGVSQRKLSNGIGADPNYPDEPAWKDLAADKQPAADATIVNVLTALFSEPRSEKRITDKTQNDIASNPAKYQLDASYIHEEPQVDADGKPVTDEEGVQIKYYYIYGTRENADAKWVFTKDTTNGGKDKHYITCWNKDSIIAPWLDLTVIGEALAGGADGHGKSLYDLVDIIFPEAYDNVAIAALDGKLRATLMQFAGAVNRPVGDESIKSQLRAKMKEYRKLDTLAMNKKFAETPGEAGCKNFMYLTLNNTAETPAIGRDSKNLYYVVEWDGGWEYYSVDLSKLNGFFDEINWEYQAPSWAELQPTKAAKQTLLGDLSDMVGKILAKAIVNLEWTMDAPGEYNAHFENNALALFKRLMVVEPEMLFGAGYIMPDLTNFSNEDVLVLIAKDVIEWLMPAMVVPSDVTCLEEILVYGVREFVADILPGMNWDDKITEARAKNGTEKENAFIDIALNMGMSIAVYYLREVVSIDIDEKGAISPIAYGPNAQWRVMLADVITRLSNTWVPGLTKYVKAQNPKAFQSKDGVLMLTAIFNTAFPSLLTTVSNCAGQGYTVDFDKIIDLIKGLLNVDLVTLIKAIDVNFENKDSLANKNLYTIAVTIVEDLLGGLGCADTASQAQFNTLKNTVNAAVATKKTATVSISGKSYKIPLVIEALIAQNTASADTNASACVLVKSLIHTLSDARAAWLQDALTIVLQAVGAVNDQQFVSAVARPNQNKYFGSATPTIVPKLYIETMGIPSVFAANGYKQGAFTVDKQYVAKLVDVTVTNVQGNEVGKKTYNVNVPLNAPFDAASFTVNVTGNVDLYTMNTRVDVTAPDGKTIIPLTLISQFMATSAAAGDDEAPAKHGDDKANTLLYQVYLKQTDALTKAEEPKMKVTNTSNKTVGADRTFDLDNAGQAVKDENGNLTFKKEGTGKGYAWGQAVSIRGKKTATVADTYPIDGRIPFYFGWPNRQNVAKGGGSYECQQWIVDTVKFSRDRFPADFTRLNFKSDSDYIQLKGKGTKYNWLNLGYNEQPLYIVLFNDYGLEDLINKCLNSGRNGSDYEKSSWDNYLKVLSESIAECYKPRNAKTFDTDHRDPKTFISNYETQAAKLQAAIDGLVRTSGEDRKDFTTSEKELLQKLGTALDTQANKNLVAKDYMMYRWLKYYYGYDALRSAYRSTIAPASTAPSTLAGVPSDKIDAAIKAAPAYVQSIARSMVDVPTTQQNEAAKARYDAFYAHLPKVNQTDIKIGMANMAQNNDRLLRVNVGTTYYLNDAINDLEALKLDENKYTAESWAAYTKALADAKAANVEGSLASLIHQERYDLLCAYKALVLKEYAADFTVLDEVVKQAQNVLANQGAYNFVNATEEIATKDAALKALLAVTGQKVTVDGNTYIIGGGDTGVAEQASKGKATIASSQAYIDKLVARIKVALSRFESATIQLLPVGKDAAVDQASFIINGIAPATVNTADGVKALVKANTDGVLLNVFASKKGFGTGALVTLNQGKQVVASYTVVVYGDINGDGAIDAFDAADANIAIVDGEELVDAYALAADVSNDSVFNATDYDQMVKAVAGTATINQTR